MSARQLNVVLVVLLAAGLGIGLWSVHKLGGWRYLAHRLHTLEPWPTYTQRASQLELLPAAESGILFLGDSHVAFGEWQELLPNHQVFNRGVPGEGSQRLLESTYLRKAFAKTSDTILLQVGTNDLLFADRLPRAYAELLWMLTADANNYVLVCTLPGVNNEVRWTGIKPRDIIQANQSIRKVAAKRVNIKLVDLAEALGTNHGVLPSSLTDDGVHLRGEGYIKWAHAIEAALER